jgi:serine/threonine protein kinase
MLAKGNFSKISVKQESSTLETRFNAKGDSMLQAEQVLHQRYQLLRQLGRTAAGRQTWLAQDLQSEEQVTLKLLAFGLQMQWEELKLFEREAQVLQALNHPQIPRYRDYFSLDKQVGEGIPWFGLVQDYIPGFSLQELLEQGKRFTPKQLQKIATDLLHILIYLHELSPPVLHRDIKPSNLILGDDKKIYLVDFGAVQAQAAVTGVTFTVVGTGGYAPLEQFWGRAVPASDLYALGATLIHLLTGKHPADFPQKDSRIQFMDSVQENLASQVSLNSHFLHWIETLTELALEKRYSTARQALKALESREKISSKRSALRRIPKPEGTYIKLNKSVDFLKIYIPAPGLRKLMEQGILGAVCSTMIASIIFLIVLSMSITALVALFPFSLLFLVWLVPLTCVCLFSLSSLFERTYVSLSRNHLEVYREIMSLKYYKIKIPVTDILGIYISKEKQVYQVNIRAINKNFNLGGALGENEASWLAQEIQQWLDPR